MPTVGILALQGDVREHRKALEACGCDTTLVRREAELKAVDGLVLPGGESTTIVRLARTFDLLEPIRERIATGLPVYGSCAGMILLADRLANPALIDGRPQETFGGIDATVRRNAFGRQVDSFETDLTVDGVTGPGIEGARPDIAEARPDIPRAETDVARARPDIARAETDIAGAGPDTEARDRPMHAVFIRAPWVEEAGPLAQPLAHVDEGVDGPAAGRVVVIRQGALLATSFHPELTGDLRLHAYFCSMVKEVA